MSVERILNSVPLFKMSIVETGSVSTIDIARWVGYGKNCEFVKFDSVDMNSNRQLELHKELEKLDLAKYATFRTAFPNQYLAMRRWIDVAFLHSKDLHTTLEEFSLALSAGVRVVVFQDFQTRSAFAIRKGQDLGWKLDADAEPYLVLRRPQ